MEAAPQLRITMIEQGALLAIFGAMIMIQAPVHLHWSLPHPGNNVVGSDLDVTDGNPPR